MDVRHDESTQEAIWLEELRWLERLALQLVRDPAEAEDLTQETWLAAGGWSEGRGERAGKERRRWLAAILRNLASKARRGRARRAGYEAQGARGEALPSADELSQRAELQERLLSMVRSLPEAYRTPLLLRYYEQASIADIALRLKLPVRTVQTRLQRGRARLRERMDRETPGGRAAWSAGLLLGWEDSHALSLPYPRGLRTAALLLVPAAAMALLWVAHHSAQPGSQELLGPAEHERVDVGPTAASETTATRRLLTEEPQESPPSTSHWIGQTVAWNGSPLGEVELSTAPLHGLSFPLQDWSPTQIDLGPRQDSVGHSDPAGNWQLPRSRESSLERILVTGHKPGWTTVVGHEAGNATASDAPALVILAPTRPLELRLVDVAGRALAGVEAYVVLQAEPLRTYPRSLRAGHALHQRITSDSEGYVRFAGAPWIAEAELRLYRGDLGLRYLPVPEAPSLLTWSKAGRRWSGVVRDSSGRPRSGQVHSTCGRWISTRADGSFEIYPESESTGLWAVVPGREPVFVPVSEVPGSRDTFELTVGGPYSEGVGQILDHRGRPLSSVRVWLADPTLLEGKHEQFLLESLASGGGGLQLWADSNSAGVFRLPGLRAERRYTLMATHIPTAQWMRLGTIEPRQPGDASAPKLFRFPTERRLERLEGRLVDSDAGPIADALIYVQSDGPGIGGSILTHTGAETRSAEDGSFFFEDVPMEGMSLRVHPHGFLSAVSPVSDLAETRDWVLARKTTVQVVLLESDAEAWFELRDEADQPLTLWQSAASGQRPLQRIALDRGRSGVLEIGCNAHSLVLHRGDGSTQVHPLSPLPGQPIHLEL